MGRGAWVGGVCSVWAMGSGSGDPHARKTNSRRLARNVVHFPIGPKCCLL